MAAYPNATGGHVHGASVPPGPAPLRGDAPHR
jgi:hypothetical protein